MIYLVLLACEEDDDEDEEDEEERCGAFNPVLYISHIIQPILNA